jgi:hypothetical protein
MKANKFIELNQAEAKLITGGGECKCDDGKSFTTNGKDACSKTCCTSEDATWWEYYEGDMVATGPCLQKSFKVSNTGTTGFMNLGGSNPAEAY